MTRLTVAETLEFSDMLAAKYIARADELTPVLVEATSVVLAARLSRYLYDQRNRPDENETLRDACVLCEGMLLADRVTIDKRNHVVTPCWVCRPRAFCAYHAMIARHEESQAEHFCCGHYLGYMRECPACKVLCRCSACKADDAPSQDLDKGVTNAPVATMAGCLGGVSPSGLRPQTSDDAPATLRTGEVPR